jgi:hypothetical protein
MMAIKDEIVPFIANLEESNVSWRTLQELFENQNVVKTLYPTYKLHSMKWKKELQS